MLNDTNLLLFFSYTNIYTMIQQRKNKSMINRKINNKN